MSINMTAFVAGFWEHLDALHAAEIKPHEAGDPAAAQRYLKFVTAFYPQAVIDYLQNEQDHFKGLTERTTAEAMASYTSEIARHIYRRSNVWRVLMDVLKILEKNNDPRLKLQDEHADFFKPEE